jgi:hypothetical protein
MVSVLPHVRADQVVCSKVYLTYYCSYGFLLSARNRLITVLLFDHGKEAALYLRTQSIQDYLVWHCRVRVWGYAVGALRSDMAFRPLSRKWTPEDDERLEKLIAQGVSIVRASAALKRKQAVVRARAAKFGYTFPTVKDARKKWSGSANSTWRLY